MNVGERKVRLREKMLALWEALETDCTREALCKANKAWRSYQAIIAIEATLPGEAQRHLEAIRESPEFLRFEATRIEYRKSQTRRRVAKWYSEKGKALRSTSEKRAELAAARRAQRSLAL